MHIESKRITGLLFTAFNGVNFVLFGFATQLVCLVPLDQCRLLFLRSEL